MEIQYELFANCDRIFYLPNDTVTFHVQVRNKNNYNIRLTDFVLAFDDGDRIDIHDLDFVLYPNSDKIFHDNIRIRLLGQYGNKKFRLCYKIYLFNDDWYPYQEIISKDEYFFNVVTQREFTSGRFIVFLSRCRLSTDRIIGDIIKTRLKQWNIDCVTVGIDIEPPDEKALQIIRKEISQADGLIAIATPRNYNIITRTWQTLEWLHAELGIAFAKDKPLLIIKEEGTELKGLPSYLVDYGNIPFFFYNREDTKNLIINIDRYMPFFREWLKKYKNNEFFDGLIEFAKISLALIGGIVVAKNIFDGLKSES